MVNKEDKIDKVDLTTAFLLIIIVLSGIIYFNENNFDGFRGKFSTVLVGFWFYICACVFAHNHFLHIIKNIGNDFLILKRITLKIICLLIYISIVTLIWIYPSIDMYKAFLFISSNIPWVKIGIISIISYYLAKGTEKKDLNSLFTSFIWSTAIIHLLTLYTSYGIDDGCTAVGGDKLFSGADYYDCDEDYKNSAEQAKEIASKYDFNPTALFAVDFIFLTLISYLSIYAAYLKEKVKFK